MDVTALKSQLQQLNQAHLLDFWHQLDSTQQKALYNDIDSANLEEACQFFKRTTTAAASAPEDQCQERLDERLRPVPGEALGGVAHSTSQQLLRYEQLGLEAVARGEVGVLLLAGGQGTRLGVRYPKGMYDVGLPSHKSLYQLQAERLLKLQQLAAAAAAAAAGKAATAADTTQSGSIVWYIMTSDATKEPTVQFFREHNYFGLSAGNLVFFEQGTLPCFAFDGRVLLESRGRLARAPDGNGGLYRALQRDNIVRDMRQRGVRYLHVYCVDNILVKMADPLFIGYCVERGADCGAKVVEKAGPTEPVGVVCQVDGQYQVVEYSEITQETAHRRNQDGRLTFAAGNICNHFFTVDFLQLVVEEKQSQLSHHVAKKKIPYADSEGNTVKPDKPNGIKMEKFVFDVFKFAKNFAVWQVARDQEFSPLKNADGAAKDTPTTCRWSLCALHQRQLVAAGGVLVDQSGQPLPLVDSDEEAARQKQSAVICEISPLVSYAGEGLEPLVSGMKFVVPLLLNPPH